MVLSEEFYPANTVLPEHAHEHSYLSLVLRGTFRERAPGLDRWVGAHDVSFHPALTVHEMTIGPEGAWTFCVELEDWHADREGNERLQRTIAAACAVGMWRLYHEVREGNEPDPGLSRRTLFAILGPLLKPDQPAVQPPWLRDVRDQIHDARDASVSVRALARSAGLHPFYLGAAFKACMGCTILEYLRRLRIAECARRLQFGADPLVEIAYTTGFADQSHMTRSFRNATGWTPAAFRRHMRIHRPEPLNEALR